MSLLNKATSVPPIGMAFKKSSKEEIELALAWLKGRISMKQVMYALGTNYNNSTGYRLARYLRQAYLEGYLKIDEGK